MIGIYHSRGRIRAEITVRGSSVYLGPFRTQEEAIDAYDNAAFYVNQVVAHYPGLFEPKRLNDSSYNSGPRSGWLRPLPRTRVAVRYAGPNVMTIDQQTPTQILDSLFPTEPEDPAAESASPV